jgi:hypothetical protein
MGLRIVISLQTILQQGVLVGRQQLCSLALCCAGLLSLLTSKGTKIACQIVYLQLPSRLRFDVRPEVKLGWTSDFDCCVSTAAIFRICSGGSVDLSRRRVALSSRIGLFGSCRYMAAEGSHSKSGFPCLDTGMSHSRRLL